METRLFPHGAKIARPLKVDTVLRLDTARAVGHHKDAIRQSYRLLDVVGHEHDALAVCRPDAQELVAHHDLRLRIERSERLVHQHDLGVIGQQSSESDTLTHAARECSWIVMTELGEPEQVEQGADAVRVLVPGYVSALESHGDVCAYVDPRQQRVTLKHEANTRLSPARVRQPNLACRGPHKARDQPENRGLAAAARPHDGQEFATVQCECDVTQYLDPPIVGHRDAGQDCAGNRLRVGRFRHYGPLAACSALMAIRYCDRAG